MVPATKMTAHAAAMLRKACNGGPVVPVAPVMHVIAPPVEASP